jgi:hypothetical protein
MEEKIKICWFVKVHTEYSGTDETSLKFDISKEEAEEEAYNEARDHAESFSNVWWDWQEEDYEEGTEEYDEAYNEAHEENSQYEVEEFNFEEHEGELFEEEIENYNKWKNGTD